MSMSVSGSVGGTHGGLTCIVLLVVPNTERRFRSRETDAVLSERRLPLESRFIPAVSAISSGLTRPCTGTCRHLSAIRWLAADDWLTCRRGLVPVAALGRPDPEGHHLWVIHTKRRVEECPDVATSEPLSQEMEVPVRSQYDRALGLG